MWTKKSVIWIAIGILAAAASPARAQKRAQEVACGCAAVVRSEVVFQTTRTNVLTVDPAGRGESLESAGITLRVRMLCNRGTPESPNFQPVAGMPAQEIQLYAPELAYCVPLMASTPTDQDGWTEFHGTYQAGGCAEHVQVWAEGYFMADIPLRINSPDTGVASPGRVDGSDLAALATHLGRPDRYSICFDFNEDGSTDASDLACFALSLGNGCP